MQNYRIFILFSLILVVTPASASQNWEICLDKADFNFNIDAFFKSSIVVTKSNCRIKFAVSGGRGEKFEIDLCDPDIHIDHYSAIDADSFRRVAAGATGCPTPDFGTNFSENQSAYNEFKDLRNRVFKLFEAVKEAYGEGSDKVDISKSSSFSPEISAGKIACGQFLLKEYLKNCISFESKKSDFRDNFKSPIPGIHPQTILPSTK